MINEVVVQYIGVCFTTIISVAAAGWVIDNTMDKNYQKYDAKSEKLRDESNERSDKLRDESNRRSDQTRDDLLAEIRQDRMNNYQLHQEYRRDWKELNEKWVELTKEFTIHPAANKANLRKLQNRH